MNLKLFLACALCSTTIFAQEQPREVISGPKEVSREDRKAEREERLRETGGYVDIVPEGPAIIIADARNAPTTNVPERVKGVINGMFRLAASNETVSLDGSDCPYSKAVEIRKRDKALIVIMLINSGEEKSALTVFPEERVAIVNIDRATQFTKGDEADIRIIKECWRGIGFISGAGYAANDASVMQPVGSPLELDTLSWQVIHPLALNQMNKFLKKYGAQRGRRMTYLRACEEGWAPEPKDEFQKAVWEKVKEKKSAEAKEKPAVAE